MKKIANFLLAAMSILAISSCSSTDSSCTPQKDSSDALEAVTQCILTRSSVRDYTDQPVDSASVQSMLRAAMAAPTAGNKQPWRFVVIDDRATLDSLAQGPARMAAKAPLAIVVCGNVDETFEGEGREFWVQDTSAATENLLLQAHALGLGAVWCGVYPIAERVALLKNLLDLPENIVPLCMVVIGHPDGEQTPKDKWKPENIHYNRW